VQRDAQRREAAGARVGPELAAAMRAAMRSNTARARNSVVVLRPANCGSSSRLR
jgi:hypothetical protein